MDIATEATFCVRPTNQETDGIDVTVTTSDVTIEFVDTREGKSFIRRLTMEHAEFDTLASCLAAYRAGVGAMHVTVKRSA